PAGISPAWTFDSLLTRGAALVMFCQFLLMLMKESSSSHDAAGGRENGGRHQAESTLPLRETAIGGWGEEAYDPTLTAMHLAGGPGEPPAVGGERLPHAALLFAAAADLSSNWAGGACIDVQGGAARTCAPHWPG
ncbi:uncharacterized protein SCHCODRAFT_02513417, partial [Schizophyllum commune H4-8]|uniref:uncharacterized protein n=1 Tax=Schizophyllum commune (strain H4-8 / FGSC 9210) TaxID=578458 RepID=UPI00215DF9EB